MFRYYSIFTAFTDKPEVKFMMEMKPVCSHKTEQVTEKTYDDSEGCVSRVLTHINDLIFICAPFTFV